MHDVFRKCINYADLYPTRLVANNKSRNDVPVCEVVFASRAAIVIT